MALNRAIKALIPTTPMTLVVATYYTAPIAPSNLQALVNNIIWSNPTAGAATVGLYNVPPGGSPTVNNRIFPSVSIAGNSAQQFNAPSGPMFIVPAGGYIAALASSVDILLTVIGEELS